MNDKDPSGPEDLSKQAERTVLLLEGMFERLPQMLAYHEEHDGSFRAQCYERWKSGLDLLKMFIVVSEEFGSTINTRGRPSAAENGDYKFEATIILHARGVLVANEMLTLLREGFPDGALGRWRTLHEIAVISTFIAQSEPEIARRFLAHRGIAEYKALNQHNKYLPRSGIGPLEPGEMERTEYLKNFLIDEFGDEFSEDFGWAYPAVAKKRIKFSDLELKTGLDHWRPRYRWSSDNIHVGAKRPFQSLGTSERPKDQPVLLTGRSDSSFTDPAHMCVISLNLANHAIPKSYLNAQDETVFLSLCALSDLVGKTFLGIERGAAP